MHMAVLNAIDEYEMNSSVADDNARYNFIRLFESENTPIFCDLFNRPGYFMENNMPVRLYSDWLLEECSAVTINLKDVKKGSIVYSDSSWYYQVTMSKSISFADDNGVLFPVEEDKTADFMLQFTYKFDTTFTQCKITEIICLNPQDFKKLNHGYLVQKRNDGKDAKRDAQVKIDGEYLEYNSFGQAYAERGNIDFWNGNIKVKTETVADEELYEYVTFKYIPRHLRVKLRAEMAINSAYSVVNDDNFAKSESDGFCFGIDLGVSATIGKILRWGWFTGVGMSMTSLNFETSPMNYSIAMTDQKGRGYNRVYDITSMSQGVQFTDIMVPLYTQLDFKLSRGVAFIIEVGAKGYYNMQTENDPYRIVADVYGDYGNGMIINDGEQAFGHIDAVYNEFIFPAAFEREKFDISLMAYAGFDINLVKNTLLLEVKGGYERGLKNSYKSDEKRYSTNSMPPLVYSSESGYDVAMQPIANCVSFKREAIWANVGLMVKF